MLKLPKILSNSSPPLIIYLQIDAIVYLLFKTIFIFYIFYLDYFRIYFMQNFNNRANYFELEKALEETVEFSEKVKTVKLISDWASEQMGYDIHEAEAYARSHIANIVRENEVSKMIRRIHNDFLDCNIDLDSAIIQEKSYAILNTIKNNTYE